MRIQSLSLQNFRSIDLHNISFTKPINIICGENNAGKTSVLEAIYFSSNLRSFKSLPNIELIQNNKNEFKISLNFLENQLNNNIFIEKSLKGSKCLYNMKKITKSELSLKFPCYSLVFGFNNILLNDSSYRREFLDSGMFHVEPNSAKHHASYERTLKQRNFLLKSKQLDPLKLWDDKLIVANNELSKIRNEYFRLIDKEFNKTIERISLKFPELYDDISSLELHYYPGWENDITFEDALKNSFKKDSNLGYTSVGSHRSDISVYSCGKSVKGSASMSTLVLSCLILNLAKIEAFHVKHGYKPTLLIDDLFFGIDNKNLSTVVKLLVHSKGNIVLTAPNIYKGILEEISEQNEDIDVKVLGE